MAPKTMFEKIWDSHVVREEEGKPSLLYVDLHLVHEVTSPQAFDGLRLNNRRIRRLDKTVAVADHNVPTNDRDKPLSDEVSKAQLEAMQRNADEFGLEYHDMFSEKQGIVHVIGPEQGRTQPGMIIVCGDSHTATHGAVGAMAFGIGTSEVEHVLATQCIWQAKAKTMEVRVDGELGAGVTPKDVILAIIGKIGTSGGIGHAIEYTGSVFREMSMEGRMTVCNMSIEAGARTGMVAPDEKTFNYLRGREYAPGDADWDAAVERWKALCTDDGATFDTVVELNAADISPQVTWGTNPAQVLPVGRARPEAGGVRVVAGAGRRGKGARVHGAERRRAHPGHRHRHGVHRLVHQLPHRGPACCRRCGEGQAEGQQRPRTRRPRLVGREAAGGGGRARPRVHRRRVRVARRQMLNVPRYEP